jgi:hypothetical protein
MPGEARKICPHWGGQLVLAYWHGCPEPMEAMWERLDLVGMRVDAGRVRRAVAYFNGWARGKPILPSSTSGIVLPLPLPTSNASPWLLWGKI